MHKFLTLIITSYAFILGITTLQAAENTTTPSKVVLLTNEELDKIGEDFSKLHTETKRKLAAAKANLVELKRDQAILSETLGSPTVESINATCDGMFKVIFTSGISESYTMYRGPGACRMAELVKEHDVQYFTKSIGGLSATLGVKIPTTGEVITATLLK